ncbi:hypothetical protein BD779DRAFT_767385 [Infundibulicybe gibba]|nr:hypothetical protein BD779DRAFT_767385 [Infundibulicybe gibba]
MSSTPSAPNVASNATAVSPYAPDEHERTMYYNGLTGNNNDHPDLIYRSDFATPFPKPSEGEVPVKSAHGVFGTPLNKVWDTVGPQIMDLMKAQGVNWSAINPARFSTSSPGELDVWGTFGPVVIWIGVIPGSTSADTAHEVSQEILALLLKNGVDSVVLEWNEAAPAEWL